MFLWPYEMIFIFVKFYFFHKKNSGFNFLLINWSGLFNYQNACTIIVPYGMLFTPPKLLFSFFYYIFLGFIFYLNDPPIIYCLFTFVCQSNET